MALPLSPLSSHSNVSRNHRRDSASTIHWLDLPSPIEMSELDTSDDEVRAQHSRANLRNQTFFIDSAQSIRSPRHGPRHSRNEKEQDVGQMRTGWFSDRESSRPPTTRPISPETPSEHEHQKDEEEPEREYPGWKITTPVMISLFTIMFLVALDGTIVATAVPSITNQFHSVADVGWYGSIYMMMRCSFILLFGKLYSFYNPKSVLLAAVTLFESGSILCGAAPSSIVLILGRGLAGLGGAGIFTGAIVAVKFMFPLERRPLVMGLIGVAFTLATVLGPLIGGALTDGLSWRWCFYINLPLGGVGMLMLVFFLDLPSPGVGGGRMTLKQQLLKLDPLGVVTFVPSMISLLLALQWGGSKYAWSNPIMIALLTVFAVLLVCFIAIQLWLQDEATVPPRIARQRSIAFALWFSHTTGGAVAVVAYYLPLWFQAIKGDSATDSGINTLPNAIATMFGSLLSGVLTSRIGYYVPFMISGPIFMAIGSGLLTTFTPATATANRIGYQIIYGLGSGGGGQQASVAAQTVLKDKDVAIGAALMIFGQTLGSAIFISVGQNVFASQLLKDIEGVPGLDYQRIMDTGATDLRSFLSGTALQLVLNAYNHAITDIFFVAVGLGSGALLGSAGMEWKSVKKNKKNKKGIKDEKQEEDTQVSEASTVQADERDVRIDIEASRRNVVDEDRIGRLRDRKEGPRSPSRALKRLSGLSDVLTI